MSRNRVHVDLSLSILSDRSLARRLGAQIAFTLSELRRDPSGLLRALWAADALDGRSRGLLWSLRIGLPAASGFGFLLGVLAYLLLIGAAPVAAQAASQPRPIWLEPPVPTPTPGRKPGGGGSGDHELARVSKGSPPPSSLAEPIVPATVKPVPISPDPLPMPPSIKAPPLPAPPDAYGDPTSTSDVLSNGPGEGGATGTGKGTGWGAGNGRGEGEGEGEGRGGGPGGPGAEDATRRLARPAVILNAPRPEYTEEARREKTQGAVKVAVLLGADGTVRSARVTGGLPNGLNEKAIVAVHKLQFRPATDASGRPVDSWISVTVHFTIR